MSKEESVAVDENRLIAERRQKLDALREEGNAFPNDFRRNVMAGELHAEYESMDGEALESEGIRVAVAGRLHDRVAARFAENRFRFSAARSWDRHRPPALARVPKRGCSRDRCYPP